MIERIEPAAGAPAIVTEYRKLQERSRYDALLISISRRIQHSLDLHTILAATARELLEAFQVGRCLIRLCDDQHPGTLLPLTLEHMARGVPHLSHGSTFPTPSLTARLLAGEACFLTPPTAGWGLPPDEQAIHDAADVLAQALVPIRSDEGILGILILHQCDVPREWTPEERDFLSALGDQVAVAIAHAKLVSRLEEEKAALQAIHDVGQVMMRERELEPMLTGGLRQVVAAMRTAAGVIYLLDADSQDLVPWAHHGISQRMALSLAPVPMLDLEPRARGEEPLAARSARAASLAAPGGPVCLEPDEHPRDGWPPGYWVTSAPLLIGKRLKGVLQIGSRSNRILSASEKQTFEILCNQFAVAIENSQAFQALKELNQLKSDFIDMASHELRTPLTAIKGFAATLSNPQFSFTEAERREFLGIINAQSDRLVRLLNDVLDVSRIEGGRVRLAFRRVCLRDLVLRVIKSLSETYPGREIEVAIAPDLAAVTDPDRLEQVLTNLVDNALKYSAPGTPVIVDGGTPSGGEVRLSVTNACNSLTEAEKERLFQKFVRLERNSALVRGTGLGLYIARNLVEMLGGQIEVETPPDGGVRFVFTLPDRQVEEVEANT